MITKHDSFLELEASLPSRKHENKEMPYSHDKWGAGVWGGEGGNRIKIVI